MVRALVTEEVEPSNLVPFSVTPDEVTAKKAADARALQRTTDTAVTIEGVGDMIQRATDILATDHACMATVALSMCRITARSSRGS